MIDTTISDEAAYARAVERYAPLVAARCRRAIPGADADDAVQAVFLVLWRRRREAPAEGPALASWLYRTTGFVLRQARRDGARRRSAEQGAAAQEPTSMDATTLSDLERAEARALIDDALAHLPAAEREAVLLSQLAGHSYAEVAEQQGCAKATVAARVQQGLGALRRRLTARGCTLSLAGLIALLGDEAQAAVPDDLTARIHRLPRAVMTGTTAAVVGARILLWSMRESPVVKIIASCGAVALCALAVSLLVGADLGTQPTPEPPSPVAAAAATPDPAPAPVEAGGRVETCLLVRWRRPMAALTAFQESPIGALIPTETVAPIARWLVGIEAVELRLDPELGAHQVGKARNPSARIAGRGVNRTDLVVSFADAAAADASPWRQAIDDGLGGQVVWTTSGDDVWSARGDGCTLSVTANGAELRARLDTDHNQGDLGWLPSLDGIEPGRLALRACVRPVGGVAIGDLLRIDLWFERGRLRLDGVLPPNGPMTRPMLESAPAVDASSWQRIPREALIAGAYAVRGGDELSSGVLRTIAMLALPNVVQGGEALTLVEDVVALSAAMDGDVVGYVEAAGGMPAMTVALPTGETEARALVARLGALSGREPDATGMLTVPLMPLMLRVGWHGRHLICSTHPDGLAAFTAQGPGFSNEADVAASIAASGEAPALGQLVVRADRILDLIGPLVGDEARAALVADGAQRLRDEREAGWMTIRAGAGGLRLEAGGAAAAVGAVGAVIAGSMAMAVSGVN